MMIVKILLFIFFAFSFIANIIFLILANRSELYELETVHTLRMKSFIYGLTFVLLFFSKHFQIYILLQIIYGCLLLIQIFHLIKDIKKKYFIDNCLIEIIWIIFMIILLHFI